MTTNDQKNDVTGPTFVFRVLNGSLNGIEFSLGAQDHFICVNDDVAKQSNLAAAERSLFIPASKPGDNFVLNLGAEIVDQEVQITICRAEHQENQRLKLNTVHQIEGVAFAIRSEDDFWSEAVLNGLPPPAPVAVQEPEIREFAAKQISPKKSKPMASLVAGLAVVAVCCAIFFTWNSAPASSLLSSLAKDDSAAVINLVTSRPGYSVHTGNNKINYLFASNAKQFEWANQVVNQNRLTANWRVVTPQIEEARLANILDRNNVAFFTLRFNDPSYPTLLLSSTRNEISKKNLDFITQLMLSSIPYAKNVHIVLEEDGEVLNRAQQGLRALGFKFETQQSESGVTLSSWMPSVDVHLTEFSRFVAQFYQTWGRRYVHFSADIRDDVMKDKSYKYGDDGYITMNKSHWMFNAKVE